MSDELKIMNDDTPTFYVDDVQVSDAPVRIWLQFNYDDMGINDDTTWCEDNINDDDVEYILLSEYAKLQAENETWRTAVIGKNLEISALQAENERLTALLSDVLDFFQRRLLRRR